MEYTRLSNSDLVISRVGFGCEPLGGTDWGVVDPKKAAAAVHKALELGINFFDTADVYGLGQSETTLSKALGNRRNDVIIASKFGVNWHKSAHDKRARTFLDSSPRRVVEALENSLRRLRIDCIKLYFIHWPDPYTPISETMEALLRCQKAGKVKYIGVSNFQASLIRECNRFLPLTAVQLPYSLIDRTAEGELLPFCKEQGISVLAYATLAQGLLTGKYGPDSSFKENDRRSRLPHFQKHNLIEHLKTFDRVKIVAEHHYKSPTQVAIRWVLDNPVVSCAITGAKSPEQIEDNVGGLGWALPQANRHYLTIGPPEQYKGFLGSEDLKHVPKRA